MKHKDYKKLDRKKPLEMKSPPFADIKRAMNTTTTNDEAQRVFDRQRGSIALDNIEKGRATLEDIHAAVKAVHGTLRFISHVEMTQADFDKFRATPPRDLPPLAFRYPVRMGAVTRIVYKDELIRPDTMIERDGSHVTPVERTERGNQP